MLHTNFTRAVAASFLTVLLLWLEPPTTARAGTYYVGACSSYRNLAPIFLGWTDSNHLSTPNECMQQSSGGGYRSLAIQSLHSRQ